MIEFSLKTFWQSVRELAEMRSQIPEERRAMSGVREAVCRDGLPRSESLRIKFLEEERKAVYALLIEWVLSRGEADDPSSSNYSPGRYGRACEALEKFLFESGFLLESETLK